MTPPMLRRTAMTALSVAALSPLLMQAACAQTGSPTQLRQ